MPLTLLIVLAAVTLGGAVAYLYPIVVRALTGIGVPDARLTGAVIVGGVAWMTFLRFTSCRMRLTK